MKRPAFILIVILACALAGCEAQQRVSTETIGGMRDYQEWVEAVLLPSYYSHPGTTTFEAQSATIAQLEAVRMIDSAELALVRGP